MTLPDDVASIFVQRADESLAKHRPDPVGMCDWCAAVWLRHVPHPCFAARVAMAVKRHHQNSAGRHRGDDDPRCQKGPMEC